MAKTIQVLDTYGCARCGEDHAGLDFRELTSPIRDLRYWATCPKTGEPILMRTVNVLLDNQAPREETDPSNALIRRFTELLDRLEKGTERHA